jgi:hypothetical protein
MLHDPLAGRGPAIPADQGQRGPRCIHELQAVDVEGLDRLPERSAERLDALRVLCRGMKRLFFSGSFRRCKARQLGAVLPRGLWAATSRARQSASVASGCFATALLRNSRWSLREPGRPPAWGFAALLPLRRHRCQSFSTKAVLTQKRSVITRCVAVPASSASMIRARRS